MHLQIGHVRVQARFRNDRALYLVAILDSKHIKRDQVRYKWNKFAGNNIYTYDCAAARGACSLIPIFNQVEFAETIYEVNCIGLFNFIEGSDGISITFGMMQGTGEISKNVTKETHNT